eukprot:5778127-Pyramimonas_sp.AAC.1
MAPATSTGRSRASCARRPATSPPPFSMMPSGSGTRNGEPGPASTATLEAALHSQSASLRRHGTLAPLSALL